MRTVPSYPTGSLLLVYLALIILPLTTACATEEPPPTRQPPDSSSSTTPGSGQSGSAPGQSSGSSTPASPASEAACCLGDPEASAHCVPGSQVPARYSTQLEACPDGTSLCVPDELRNGASPVTCTSIGGAEGRCLSVCIPQVGENAGILPDDGCQPGQRCAPCVHPLTNQETGACSIGS